MKKLFLLNSLFFLLAAFVVAREDCSDFPKPLPGRLVNDFYNKIDDKTEWEIEELLRKYNDSTSIEIAVVTLEDLSNEYESRYATDLGNCWGVGKKGRDNGIVLLVSFEGERKWAIATGKGIEQYLTDYRASSIGHEVLVPKLKEGEVDSAFIKTVDAIIGHLGWDSWEKREYWREWNEESEAIQEKYHNRDTSRGFTTFFRFVLYLASLCFIFWCIVNLVKLSKAKKRIKGVIKKMDFEIKNFQIPVIEDNWPNWALEKMRSLEIEKKSLGESYDSYKRRILIDMKRNSLEAEKSLPILSEFHNKIIRNFDEISNVPKEKRMYEEEALPKIQKIENKINSSLSFIKEKINEGFSFENYSNELNSNLGVAASWKSHLQEENPKPDSFKECCDLFERISEQVEKLETSAKDYVNHHKKIISDSGLVTEKIKNLQDLRKDKYGPIIKRMKREYPKNVWEGLEKKFLSIKGILEEGESDLKRGIEYNSKIEELNSLNNAWKIYLIILEIISEVESIYVSIEEVVSAQEKAKQDYERMKNSAKEALEKAVEKCKKSHVKSEAKNLRDDASSKMKKAERMLSSGIVDWVLLLSILYSIKETAESSYSRAKRDISNYSYSSSSYSSSSSSSSSFGGFGGGGFGGGGAGGGW